MARTESKLKELAEEVAGLGGRAIAIPTDVSDKAQIKEAVAAARDEFGEIHILINSAGVLDNEPIANHNDEAWEHHYGVNVNSYFYTIREIIGEMIDRRAGRIINIASTSSKVPIGPNRAAYVSSKHAVLGLTKEIAFEAAPFGVTVNAICPGFVLTDMVEDSMRKFARDSGQVARGDTGDVDRRRSGWAGSSTRPRWSRSCCSWCPTVPAPSRCRPSTSTAASARSDRGGGRKDRA